MMTAIDLSPPDPTTEQLYSLSVAITWAPPARRGRRQHISTWVRWILRGVRLPDGTLLRLPAVRIGSRWMVSREAWGRWIAAQTPPLDDAPAPSSTPTPTRRRAAAERAAAELES